MAATRTVAIPEGASVEMDGYVLKVKGPKGQLERNMRFPQIKIEVLENEVEVSTSSDRKRTMAMVGTFAAHANNMCIGVTEGFEYRLKVVYSHFPIQLKMSGDKLEIVNFLGEKKSRYATIDERVKANIGNDEIVLMGIDKEMLGNSSANIEHATKIRKRDPRTFQDGIYIVQKG